MEKLACLFRAAYTYAIAAHHEAHGSTFYQDHEAFVELYEAYEEAFDDIVEQAIGLGLKPNVMNIAKCGCDLATSLADPSLFPNEVSFGVLMKLETDIQTEIGALYATADIGTQNMLAQMFEDSQRRANYKIKQRLTK